MKNLGIMLMNNNISFTYVGSPESIVINPVGLNPDMIASIMATVATENLHSKGANITVTA